MKKNIELNRSFHMSNIQQMYTLLYPQNIFQYWYLMFSYSFILFCNNSIVEKSYVDLLSLSTYQYIELLLFCLFFVDINAMYTFDIFTAFSTALLNGIVIFYFKDLSCSLRGDLFTTELHSHVTLGVNNGVNNFLWRAVRTQSSCA